MGHEPPDWDLAARVRAGDDRAFDAMMERYKRPIVSFVYRLLGNAADADDVAQDVFVRAYRALRKPGLDPGAGQFSTWLFQIARHAALDRLRWRKRHPTEPLVAPEDGGTAAVTGQTAAQEVAAREVGAAIAAAVALLPEKQRTAVILSEYQGLSHAESAAIMKASAKAVELHLYRARQFLRARLAHLLQ